MKKLSMYLMAVIYVALGINHFLNPEFYMPLMPPYLPWHLALVYISGVAEIVLGLLLFPRATRKLAAWGIVLMLLVFYLVHIHMLLNPALYPDIPVWALWARMGLQVLLIAWAWWYTRDDLQAEKQASAE